MLTRTIQENSTLRNLALGALALGVGTLAGLAVVAGNPVLPFVALLGLLALPWLVTRPSFDLVAVVAVITLLPFATMPVRLAVLTPTLLEITLVFLYIALGLRLLLDPERSVTRTPLDGWLFLFLGCTLLAFVLGIWRDPSSDVFHNYFKLVLSIGLFFATANVLRDAAHTGLLLKALALLGALEAAIGAALWRAPDTLATSLLTRLSVVGYPTDRVVRYIEDNPALGERAVGTQVDPNSFGGLLVIIAVITGVALLARRPIFPRWALALMLLVDLAALVLTQSRSALLGVLAAGVFVATLRYRRLWGWGLAAGIVVAALGVGSGYLGRLVVGLQFQDQANQMRLAEYANAIEIIKRYPAFGVGFGTAGQLDLTTGVSSVYLTVAERTGLLGLLAYGAVLVAFFGAVIPVIVMSSRRRPHAAEPGEGEWSLLDTALLGGTAAVLGASVVGFADHYYFNIEFPHTVAAFWLAAALALAARQLLLNGFSSAAKKGGP